MLDKEFDKLFSTICHRRSKTTVWKDFVHMYAISIANACNFNKHRETEYMSIAKRYNQEELIIFTKMAGRLVMALEEKREQDFLGQLFMEYHLGDINKAQYFTPYHVAELMSKINCDDSEKPYVIIQDPASGSGVMLIADANKIQRHGGNIHTDLFVIAQELDPDIAMMCFIQLSLLGLAGYVLIGNSITEQPTGSPLIPTAEGWCTPMFYHPVWRYRRFLEGLKIGGEISEQ